jgi:hypothetical protein
MSLNVCVVRLVSMVVCLVTCCVPYVFLCDHRGCVLLVVGWRRRVKCVCSLLHARTHLKKKKKFAPVIRVVVVTRRFVTAEWWYNTCYHTATRMTPFEEFYGQKPPSVLSYMLGVLKVQEVDTNIIVYEDIIHALKSNLAMVENHMKKQEYQGHSECHFVEGN